MLHPALGQWARMPVVLTPPCEGLDDGARASRCGVPVDLLARLHVLTVPDGSASVQCMSKKTISVDGVDYVRADSVLLVPDGNRHIVFLDRGFIFEGVLTLQEGEDGAFGTYTLTDCSNIRKWSRGGIGGLLKSAVESGATLDPSPDVRFQEASEIFMAPTPLGWKE